jgi:hypothetical protein
MRGIQKLTPDVTALLLAWRAGDDDAMGRTVPLVQDELRQIARRCLRHERTNHTLQATALVNEAYVRLIDARRSTAATSSTVKPPKNRSSTIRPFRASMRSSVSSASFNATTALVA